MLESQKRHGQSTGRSEEKGGSAFDNQAWDGKGREDLIQELYDMIESAPREVAVNWLQSCLLPMLEEKRREGGVQTSA